MAEALLASLPQVDKRVVLLSNLADGQAPDGAPLGESLAMPLWVPLDDIAGDRPDCAVLSADNLGGRIRVRVACGKAASAAGRTIELRQGDKVLGSAVVEKAPELTIVASTTTAGDLTVHLLGGDAIASDDVAPVLVMSTGSIGVVAEASDETAVTGGPPVVEQALTALETDLATRPLPAVPDQAVDFAGVLGLVVDDPPGFTPEQRRALEGWLEGGGVLLLALGPRGASAPLGATLEPLLPHATSWRDLKHVKGVAAGASTDFLGEATRSLVDLGATKRSVLAPDDKVSLDVLVSWSDGEPLVLRKVIGRGEAFLTTLPFSLGASNLALRPAFLALLDAFVTTTRAHAAPRRTDVGSTWTLPAAATRATGPDGNPVEIVREEGRVTLTPTRIGAYHVVVDGRDELRVAAPIAKETDLRPRRATKRGDATHLGATQAQVDISGYVAVALLGLMLAELVLRIRARREEPA